MGKRWTDKQLNELEELKPGSVRKTGSSTISRTSAPQAAEVQRTPAIRKKSKAVRTRPPALQELISWLSALKIPFELEHRFHPTRGWRFDIALPWAMVAIEYEGIFSETSRHTTLAGYTEDAQKYNAAQILGWRVLRYTSKNHKRFLSDIADILLIKTS